ncbi:MAG: VWA domain-containing protein, partial [Gemmatimonadales bacterium]|nr:VWA domain-containing protein [Gemmatimonadales bacterium]
MIETFGAPWALALVPPWLAVAWWLRTREQAGRAAALVRLGDAATLARTSRLGDGGAGRRALLRALAVAAALLALARPQGERLPAEGERLGRDVLVALDLSRSMQVRDVGGSRLERARALIADVAGELPGDRLGLVVFGGAAFLQLPLTTDHAVFQRFVEAAREDILDDPSTNLGAPLALAATVFAREGGDGHRAVLVVSDGEDGAERIDDELPKLLGAQVPVFAIGVGTPAGGLVPADSAEREELKVEWHVDGIGRPVTSVLGEASLQGLARATGGAYARFDDGAARAALLERLRAISARPIGAQSGRERRELFGWPLALAALLLALEGALALGG